MPAEVIYTEVETQPTTSETLAQDVAAEVVVDPFNATEAVIQPLTTEVVA